MNAAVTTEDPAGAVVGKGLSRALGARWNLAWCGDKTAGGALKH